MERTSDSVTRLVDDLQGGDEFARAQAAFALGMLGEPAVQPLVQLLIHPNHEVRMRAAWAIGVIGHAALPMLLDVAEGSDPTLRAEAVRVLGSIGEGRAISQLILALTDADVRIAQRAATALGKIGDVRAFHPLLTALGHPAADVRYAACTALGYLHVAAAAPYLAARARDDYDKTSWGASVADAARRAIAEIHAAQPTTRAAEQRFDAVFAGEQPETA
jgi:HEAT repeat protein